jgi:outer membrane receptor protein involved in Fe transport
VPEIILHTMQEPLFVNDTVTGRSFNIVYEPSLNDVRVHGEVGYTTAEQFSLLAGVTFNQYSNLELNDKAYGLIPVEFNGSIRYQGIKDLLLKADMFSWRSIQYRTKDGQNKALDPALDLNAGAEFAFLPQWKAFLQFNNIFNNKYERWNQYPVLGFNMLIGVVYSFGELKTK